MSSTFKDLVSSLEETLPANQTGITSFEAYERVNKAWKDEFGEDLPDYKETTPEDWSEDRYEAVKILKVVAMKAGVASGKFNRDEVAYNNYTFRNLGRVAQKAYSDWKKEPIK